MNVTDRNKRQGEQQMEHSRSDSENTTSRRTAAVPATSKTCQAFRRKELAKLSADGLASRLVDIWNSFAGVAPFTELSR